MKRFFLPLLLLGAGVGTAHAEVRVSIDPLPYGSVQLSYNQYMIPNVNGINVLVYSDKPLPFAEPGKPYDSRYNITVNPLPFGAVRMNDTQYLLKTEGLTIMLMANNPLAFQQTSLTMEAQASQTPKEAPLAVKEPVPAPVMGPASQTPKAPLAVKEPVPAPVMGPAPQPNLNLSAVYKDEVLAPKKKKPELLQAAPASREEVQEPAVKEMIQQTTSAVQFKGLPPNVVGTVIAREEQGQIRLAYSLTNLAQDPYLLNPVKLSVKQSGIGVRASLDRRSGNLTPGIIPPGKGEIGTITLNRTASAPVELTWTIQNQTTGENYQLRYQY